MKIYFCESCGASVPLQEVVGGRATATNGKVYCTQHMPGAQDGDLKLYFCDACGVSIPLQEVITGKASTGGDRTLCASCARKPASREGSSDRFRLYFCDACNTSVPQSHVVTGRALVRGGKTYCEACRDRATRKMSPVIPVVGVVILAAAALMLVLVFGPGAKDDAPAVPAWVGKLNELEQTFGTRVEGLNSENEDLRGELEDVLRELRDTRERATRDLAQLEAKIKILEAAVAERETLRAKVRDLEAEVARLKVLEKELARLGTLERELASLRDALANARPAPGPAPEPRPNEPVTPAPGPSERDVPATVKAQIDLLGNPDSGKRFSAAVELGKLEHAAAVPALGKVLLKDEDYFVRRAAARALGKINQVGAVPALIDALMDDEIFVSLQAAKSLRSITSEEFGFDENLSASQRRRIQSKWKKWWKSQSAKK